MADSSSDENILLLFAGGDTDPGVYYIFDRKARNLRTFLVARAELEGRQATRYVSPVAFVMLHAALGQADEAFGWLDRAYEQRRGWLAYLNVEPMLDGLRADPRFRRLQERMRLT